MEPLGGGAPPGDAGALHSPGAVSSASGTLVPSCPSATPAAAAHTPTPTTALLKDPQLDAALDHAQTQLLQLFETPNVKTGIQRLAAAGARLALPHATDLPRAFQDWLLAKVGPLMAHLSLTTIRTPSPTHIAYPLAHFMAMHKLNLLDHPTLTALKKGTLTPVITAICGQCDRTDMWLFDQAMESLAPFVDLDIPTPTQPTLAQVVARHPPNPHRALLGTNAPSTSHTTTTTTTPRTNPQTRSQRGTTMAELTFPMTAISEQELVALLAPKDPTPILDSVGIRDRSKVALIQSMRIHRRKQRGRHGIMFLFRSEADCALFLQGKSRLLWGTNASLSPFYPPPPSSSPTDRLKATVAQAAAAKSAASKAAKEAAAKAAAKAATPADSSPGKSNDPTPMEVGEGAGEGSTAKPAEAPPAKRPKQAELLPSDSA